MKTIFSFTLLFSITTFAFSQKKTLKERVEEFPEMLIAQPEAGPDSNANRLVMDNLYLVIPTLWKEKGVNGLTGFTLTKADKEPLVRSFPVSEKKIVHGLTITMGQQKKPSGERKRIIVSQIRQHLTAYYKAAGKDVTADELVATLNNAVSSPEEFLTDRGKKGEVYVINDIEAKQSNFIVLLLLPDEGDASYTYVQFTYYRFNYETTLPEDPYELRTFLYPDEQEAYVEYTKKMLKTLMIK